ncbi:MAG: D-alanyl-D-alanine carboxypeptidase [Acidobacteria bacterium]|nr:D-alanyl-D-alanine carboxypeptidase [Acidobacteriota bacterium]
MALTRRQIYARRRIAVFGSIGLVLAVAFYLPMTLLAPLHSAEPVIVKHGVLTGSAADLAFPGYGGSAIGAIGFDGVLAQSGSTGPLPMASITKLVTMLVVLQVKPLTIGHEGPSITMTPTDVGFYTHYLSLDGSVAPVRTGWRFTQHELMELSLVHSANNYAASLAVWAFGSMDAYLTAAKSWVASHRLSSMTITDPTGIEPTDAASTVDLLTLGKLALANPVIAAIVATKSVTIHDIGTLTNTNALLGSDGIDGIKTGTLNGAGANLLFAATHQVGDMTVTIVGVVLGGETHTVVDTDILNMMTGVFAGFHQVHLVTKGDVFARYTSQWGQTTTAVAEKSASIVTWGNTAVTSSSTVTPIATGTTGQSVGTATFTVAGRTIRVPLGLSTSLTDPGPGWRLSHPGLIAAAP